ncbi:MAG: tRNA threonylcarbamoyladenosine dehydratase [Lachnoclostridium sp.]|nr:tRNA threonylcarbamoyladenosine dehydratase [Lachnoclostridium sp.]
MANEIFSRTAMLAGLDGFERLQSTRVIIFGLGGVGSWAAEAMIRSGIGHLTMVDADVVAPSNINRQLPALHSTIGQPKTDVMLQRLRDINPEADIVAINALYTTETADNFDLDSFDYVIDAIDSLSDKALLILRATASRARLFSSMGAALKMDPEKISVAEFWKVTGCPLAAALRRKFKKSGHLPRRKFKCVYSPELLPNHPEAAEGVNDVAMKFGKVATNGAMMHITATFGMMLASLVIRDRVSSR